MTLLPLIEVDNTILNVNHIAQIDVVDDHILYVTFSHGREWVVSGEKADRLLLALRSMYCHVAPTLEELED